MTTISQIPFSLGGANFSAQISANVTGIASGTVTQIDNDSVAFNTGSFYSTSTYRWTPPAGVVLLIASCAFSGTFPAGMLAFISIYKNGSLLLFATSSYEPIANSNTQLLTLGIDIAGGTDYYDARAYAASTGAWTAVSGNGGTSFQGTLLL